MGIGRRQFIQQFAAAIGALAAAPSIAVAIFDDQYVNRKLGIAFRKPPDWTFADVKDMGEVSAGQILDLDDPDLARQIVDSMDLPILTISRDGISADGDRFTPAVTIHLDRLESPDELQANRGLRIPSNEQLDSDIAYCTAISKDFRVTSRPRLTEVSACHAAEYDASFVFEHENMRPTRVRMQTLAIFQRPAFYTIRMYDSPDTGPEMTFDYTQFVGSVRMV